MPFGRELGKFFKKATNPVVLVSTIVGGPLLGAAVLGATEVARDTRESHVSAVSDQPMQITRPEVVVISGGEFNQPVADCSEASLKEKLLNHLLGPLSFANEDLQAFAQRAAVSMLGCARSDNLIMDASIRANGNCSVGTIHLQARNDGNTIECQITAWKAEATVTAARHIVVSNYKSNIFREESWQSTTSSDRALTGEEIARVQDTLLQAIEDFKNSVN